MEVLISWNALKLAILFFVLVALFGLRMLRASDTISPIGVALLYGGGFLALLGLAAIVVRGLIL